jgi:hypothetical protein
MDRKAIEKLAIALFAADQHFMFADQSEIEQEWNEYIPIEKDMKRKEAREILESISYFKLLEVYEATKKYHDLKTAYENEAQAFYDGHTDFFPSDLEEHMKEAHEKLLDLILKKP